MNIDFECKNFGQWVNSQSIKKLKIFNKNKNSPLTPARIAITLHGCHDTKIYHEDKTTRERCVPGEAFLFSPGVENINTGLQPRHVLTLIFYPQITQFNFVKHSGNPRSLNSLITHKAESSQSNIRSDILQALIKLGYTRNSDEKRCLILQALLLEVVESMDNKISQEPSKAKFTWFKIYNYLQENYHTPISRELIAKEFFISPNYVSTLCKRQSGQGLNDVLTTIRLTHACLILKNEHITVSETSYRCGYESPNYFIRVFKKAFGLTPTAYKLKSQISDTPP
jgi:AraC-like DNA-binding protein